jgi:Pyruvate/2-oxoacid:ferredoxin oxidoreductase delta subunit
MVRECKQEVAKRPEILALRKRRKELSPVESGFLKKEAIEEAQRYLSSRECEACEVCRLLCPDLCVTRDEETGEVLIDLDDCKGYGICVLVCPKGAIRMVVEDRRD